MRTTGALLRAGISVGLFASLAVLSRSAPETASPVLFRNIAAEAGIKFTLQNHPTERKHLIETMPGGVAAFDYNNDGRPDLFFTNGAAVPSLEKGAGDANRLYRNDGNGKFTDVTDEAGLAGTGYAMGAAAADFDNDGHVDLFVAGVYHNALYRNLGNGKFVDVTAKAGFASDRWSVAAGWFDYDNDGLLDLFVVNYAQWTPAFDRFCGDQAKGLRVYCHPRYFTGLANRLYRNKGNGVFEDDSDHSGIAKHVGRGMSVAFADYDNDGFLDAFVTNDKLPNFLFHNKGDGTFEETGLLAGVALPDDGKAISSMGADFRDYDNDGLPDISVTALAGETFPLFRNLGKGLFRDATHASRLATASASLSGWSNGFYDFNNDGAKDLFTANSHVNDRIEATDPSTTYQQANSIFVNTGGTFRQIPAGLEAVAAHRGAAFADFDGDGKVDIAISALGARAELWQNVSPGPAHWLHLKLTGSKSNRDGIGATVRIGQQVNHMTSAVGYASSSHDGVHFGLASAKVDQIEIRWPSGRTQVLKDLAADRVLEVREP